MDYTFVIDIYKDLLFIDNRNDYEMKSGESISDVRLIVRDSYINTRTKAKLRKENEHKIAKVNYNIVVRSIEEEMLA